MQPWPRPRGGSRTVVPASWSETHGGLRTNWKNQAGHLTGGLALRGSRASDVDRCVPRLSRFWFILAVFVVGALADVRVAQAKNSDAGTMWFNVPEQLDVVMLDEQIWSMAKPSGSTSGGGWKLRGNRLDFSGTATCPDFDETLVRITVKVNGKSETRNFSDNLGSPERRFTGSMTIIPEGKSCYQHIEKPTIQVTAWCSPYVGKDTHWMQSKSILLDIECTPETLETQPTPTTWTHMCPAGYESMSSEPYGYAPSSTVTSSAHGYCRRVDKSKVGPPPGKDPDEVALEQYETRLAIARGQLDVFHAAGLRTIYEFAKAHPDKLTSVLGIARGKAVAAAATNALSSQSLVDPNWLVDEYFLIRPKWFVDPRLRGTKNATMKIDAAQEQLVELQKRKIVTLGNLADADPAKVATWAGVPVHKANGWVAAAKTQATYANKPSDLAVHRDWVIHPAWLVDTGLLPSARIIRSRKLMPPSQPIVTVTQGADLASMPPANAAKVPGKLDKPAKRSRVRIIPAGPRSQGSKPSGRGAASTPGRDSGRVRKRTPAQKKARSKRRRKRRRKTGRGRSGRQGGGSRGGNSIPRSGEGGSGSRGRGGD